MRLRNMLARGPVFGAMLLAAVLGVTAANAQDSFSEKHIDAARQVVTATKALEPFDNILPVLAEQTRTLFIQSDPSRTAEISEVTTDVAIKLAARRSELNKLVYEVWARRFSEEELVQLAEFYTSPLGAKLAKEGPVIAALSIGAARQWQDKISTEMVALVREELDKRAAE
ncbi:MAG: DUF2059 domain-containing protein [Rhodobacteraceae bacterium]|nr:DUF2059 domain-containing protein [Paracoccaceae bacterium]